MGTSTPETHKRVHVVAVVVVDHHVCHIQLLTADRHTSRFVAAGAQNRAADRQHARERTTLQPHRTVLHQAAEAIPEADDVHAVHVLGRPSHGANSCVQTRTIPAGGQDTHILRHRSPPLPGSAETCRRTLTYLYEYSRFLGGRNSPQGHRVHRGKPVAVFHELRTCVLDILRLPA